MGTLKIENGSISANTFIGSLSGTADYTKYIIDSTSGSAIQMSYGADSLVSPFYLAAWDGYTLKSTESRRFMGVFHAGEESDANNLLITGNYRLGGTVSNAPSTCSYGQLLVLQGYDSSDTITQLIFPYHNQDMFFRSGTLANVASKSWSTVLTNNNFTDHLNSSYLSLSGGTMTGAINFSIHGVTGSIGPANSGWFHFYSDVSFYFDNSVFIKGALAIYNANSKGCGNTFPSNPSNGQIFFKFS